MQPCNEDCQAYNADFGSLLFLSGAISLALILVIIAAVLVPDEVSFAVLGFERTTRCEWLGYVLFAPIGGAVVVNSICRAFVDRFQ